MMLLRTLVLEHGDQGAPVNGALLCGFAVAQIQSNFLVYSLDEEVEPGNSRVYIAALRKKADRHFLSGVESSEDLQVAMQAFKQILMAAAASSSRTGSAEAAVPYHFIDMKGCKLPPARPEDHHSMIIKKALVMKVITLGISAPVLPAIESATLIVPSIRFSSQMVSPPRIAKPSRQAAEQVSEPAVNASLQAPLAVAKVPTRVEPTAVTQFEPDESASRHPAAQTEHATLVEVDNTLTNLAKVAQELAQKQLAVVEREQMLEQWEARLQQAQAAHDEKSLDLEQRETQLHQRNLQVDQKAGRLSQATAQVSDMRQHLQDVLLELDRSLES
ncbi:MULTISPECIES: hypothetical protein [Pseudomonas]|uniref:hypothetical protein n=1 Tax=Pseudomonas TaxID=286 RepID=UPI001AEAC785|nr:MULTISPECIES: hypothetical protein [unclassified Pseudomonas]MBP1123630.1 hypothetical protein [Pseudomonas sp. PvP025]MDQ0397490.1 hypothetical protein [Pseudomonas sp. PvP006]